MTIEPLPGRIKQKALRLLALRDRSEAELRKKLKTGGYEEDLIDGLLTEFKERGYINDVVFTERQVRYLACEKLYGNRRIDLQLRDKGLPREQIRLALAEVRREFSEADALKVRLARKEKGWKAKHDPAERRRLAQNLMRQGFSPELIFEMIDTTLEE